jgi:hypothetical protein
MNRKIGHGLAGLIVFLATAGAQVFAASPIMSVPQPAEVYGTIDHLNLGEGRVVIDDTTYLVAPNSPVTADGRQVGLNSLRKGGKIGITVIPSTSGSRPIITRIRLLPDNFVPPETD